MSKTIELVKVRNGETFALDGVDFVKLDDDNGAVFALTADVILKNIQFEKEGTSRKCHNDFNGSNLCEAIYRWVLSEHDVIYDAITTRSIDLTTMDGLTDYGCPTAFARALTIDEYRKYRRFIPAASELYWLATGHSAKRTKFLDIEYAYIVGADDAPGFVSAYLTYIAARPSFYLNPATIVSVEDGEEGPVLAGFTDKELMDELYRRRRATYDPD